MNILITGASGFIGVKLMQTLAQNKKYYLRALVRNPATFKNKCSAPVESFYWNPEKKEIDYKAIENVDLIIHLAGENIASGRWTPEKKQKLINSRVEGANLLLSEIKKLKRAPLKFISSSAIGFYGNRGEEIIDENSEKGSGFLADLCSKWEAKTLDHCIDNMKFCVVRTGIVLGTDGGALQKMLIPFKLGLGGRLGSGRQFMSWIHIDDLVNIFVFLIESNEFEGIFNATAPTPITNKEFTNVLGNILRRPALLHVPSLLLKMALGEMSEILLEGQRVIPKRLLQNKFQFHFPKLEGALEAILKK